MTATAVADPKAREFLRNADPVLARLIDERPDFQPRAWLDELPPLDAFGTLIFSGRRTAALRHGDANDRLPARRGLRADTCPRRPSCSRLIRR